MKEGTEGEQSFVALKRNFTYPWKNNPNRHHHAWSSEYYDDSDADIYPPSTWTSLDSFIESKWGLDAFVDEAIPVTEALGLKLK